MKRATDYDYILKEFPLFSGLTAQQQSYVRQKARFREFKKGQTV